MSIYVLLVPYWVGIHFSISISCIRLSLGILVICATADDIEACAVSAQYQASALYVQNTALMHILKNKAPEEYNEIMKRIEDETKKIEQLES